MIHTWVDCYQSYVSLNANESCVGGLQTEAFAREESERIEKEGQVVSDSVYYMHQTVGKRLAMCSLVLYCS